MVAGGGWDIEKDEKGGRTMGTAGASEWTRNMWLVTLCFAAVFTGVAMLFCSVCTLC